jgi:hypothetical protein
MLILENQEWFLSNVNYKSDELKRLKNKKKSIAYEKSFFKNLNFD